MGGGKSGNKQEPAYTPKYAGLLEDVLTGSALGAMIKQNPNAAGFLRPYQGQGMIGGGGRQGQGQGQKGGQSSQPNPFKFGV